MGSLTPIVISPDEKHIRFVDIVNQNFGSIANLERNLNTKISKLEKKGNSIGFSLSASLPVFTDANKNLVSNPMTGTENVVMSASPTGTGTWNLPIVKTSGAVSVGTSSASPTQLYITGGIGVTSGIQIQDVETNATEKISYIKTGHYTNSEEPVTMMSLSSGAASSFLHIGGGSASENLITQGYLYAAANNTTLGIGTPVSQWDQFGFLINASKSLSFSNSLSNSIFDITNIGATGVSTLQLGDVATIDGFTGDTLVGSITISDTISNTPYDFSIGGDNTLLDTSNSSVVFVDVDGNDVDVSSTADTTFGLTAGTTTGQQLELILNDDTYPDYPPELSDAVASSADIRWAEGYSNGTVLLKNTSYRFMWDGSSWEQILAKSIQNMISDSAGNIGIGSPFLEFSNTQPTADSLVHIMDASAGSVSAPANTAFTIESNGDIYGTFLTPNGGESGWYFGDVANSSQGKFSFDNADNSFKMNSDVDVTGLVTAQKFKADATYAETVSGTYGGASIMYEFSEGRGWGYNAADDSIFAAMKTTFIPIIITPDSVGIGDPAPTSPSGVLHIKKGSSGVAPDTTNTDVIIESDSATGISIIIPNTEKGYIFGGDPEDANIQGIVFNMASNRLELRADGNSRLYLDSAAWFPKDDNAFDLGKSGNRYDDVYATNGTIQTSQLTMKTDIKVSSLGLGFINSLNPISYKWKKTKHGIGKRDHFGFGAEDVKATLDSLGVDFAGYVETKHDTTDENGNIIVVTRKGLRYHEFISPLVKATQELSQENDTIKSMVEDLIKEVDKLGKVRKR